jgi:hypothetical protein
MIHHTMIVSFNDEIPETELNQYLAEMREVTSASGLTESFAAQRHIRVPADDHAPVLVATAIVQFATADIDKLNAAFTAPGLEEFIGRWQERYPYKVVWANHQPLV